MLLVTSSNICVRTLYTSLRFIVDFVSTADI